MAKNVDAEANARIFGILSLIFSFIPIVGLLFGVIATQKGRGGRSSFALTAGWIGIALSVFFAILFGTLRYQAIQEAKQSVKQAAEQSEKDEKNAKYQSCIDDRLHSFSTNGVYSVAEAQCDWARP